MSEAPSLTTEQTTAEDLDEILAEELASLVPPPEPPSTPRIDLTLVRFSSELLDTIPQEIAEQYKLLPVYLRKPKKKKRSSTPGLLYIATADPNDQAALEDCSLCCNLQVRAFLADQQEIAEAIPIVYRGGQLARPESPLSSQQAPSVEAPPVPTPVTPVLAPPATAPSNGAPPPSEVRPTSSSMPELPLVRPTGTSTHTVPSPAPESSAPAPTPPQSQEPQAPLLVVLGGDTTLANYGHEAVAPLGGQIDVWEFGQTSSKDSEAPTLLLVSEEVYLFDRRAFNLLAFRLGVPLVVWSQEMDPADLQAVLLGARRLRVPGSPSIPPA